MYEINEAEFESALMQYLRLRDIKIKFMKVTQKMLLKNGIHCFCEVINDEDEKYYYQLSKRNNDIKIIVLRGASNVFRNN